MVTIQRLRRDRFRDRDLYDPQIKMVAAGAYNEVQHGRYLRLFQKFLGMKGREPSEVTLAAEIAPSLPLFHGVENRYLEAWGKFASGISVAASVGNFSVDQLRNPVGSNVVGVVEQIIFGTGGVTQQMAVSMGSATGTIGGAEVSLSDMDPRSGPRGSTCVQSSANNLVGQSLLTGSVWQVLLLANTSWSLVTDDMDGLPLLPGQAIRVHGGQVNANIVVSIQWRERFLEDSERA